MTKNLLKQKIFANSAYKIHLAKALEPEYKKNTNEGSTLLSNTWSGPPGSA